jgi:hypothetical protein
MNITPGTITFGGTATASLQSILGSNYYLWDINGGTITPVLAEAFTSVTIGGGNQTSSIIINSYAGNAWTGNATSNGVTFGADITGTGTASIPATFSEGTRQVVAGGFAITSAVKVIGFNDTVNIGHYCTWRVTNNIAECSSRNIYYSLHYQHIVRKVSEVLTIASFNH